MSQINGGETLLLIQRYATVKFYSARVHTLVKSGFYMSQSGLVILINN